MKDTFTLDEVAEAVLAVGSRWKGVGLAAASFLAAVRRELAVEPERTYRTGRVGEDYLISEMERLL